MGVSPQRPGHDDQRLGPDRRLRRAGEFRDVYQHRTSVADKVLVVYGKPNEHGRMRLGLSVSRKVGPAVQRNRWKRLIRESFRQYAGRVSLGMDVIVIPRRGIVPQWDQVDRSLPRLLDRLSNRLKT